MFLPFWHIKSRYQGVQASRVPPVITHLRLSSVPPVPLCQEVAIFVIPHRPFQYPCQCRFPRRHLLHREPFFKTLSVSILVHSDVLRAAERIHFLSFFIILDDGFSCSPSLNLHFGACLHSSLFKKKL